MIPLLINQSESMVKVRLVTLKDHAEDALKRLQEIGLLHVEEAQELNPVDREAIENQRNRVRTALNTLNDIIDRLPGERTVSISDDGSLALDDIIERTTRMRRSISEITDKYDLFKADLDNLLELGQHLELLSRSIDIPLRDLQYSGSYLFTNVVVQSEELHRIFAERVSPLVLHETSVAGGGAVVTYFAAKTTNRKTIETIIRDLGIATLKMPSDDITVGQFIERNREIIQKRRQGLEELQKEIQQTVENNLEELALFREVLAGEDERLTVLQQANEARYVTLIEGWVPESRSAEITAGLREFLTYSYVETTEPVRGDAPPTKLKNPKGVQPFEVIVQLFSLPKYGDWDPTPSVAYFFAFFFGLMLNDFIYAVGLLFLARFLLDKLVDDPASEGTRLFRNVLYISGSVAVVLGILSGTYLGDFFQMFFGIQLESLALIKQVQTQLSNPISFIILSLIIGLIHLNIAHMLALIRGVKEHHPGIVISKIGLFLVQIFGIPYLFQNMLGINLLPLDPALYGSFLYPLIGGVVLVIVGAFVEMGALGAVFWIFDLTGILGDVMSYSRLAGVGLATFYLASSFNLLSDWVSKTISSAVPGIIGIIFAFLVGVALLLAFHIFNLLLSTLAAFIHSLRLCFVEFLLKFYEGGGKEYAPFHLKFRKEIIVGKKS